MHATDKAVQDRVRADCIIEEPYPTLLPHQDSRAVLARTAKAMDVGCRKSGSLSVGFSPQRNKGEAERYDEVYVLFDRQL